MKYKIIAALAFAVVFIPAIGSAASAKFTVGEKIYVVDGPLNVRSSASRWARSLGGQPTGATGVVVGGPVASGGYNWWNINYTNAPSGWSAENYLAAAPALTITNASLSNGTVGVPYSAQFAATGGKAPYTWTDPSCSGACNTGMTFVASGLLSGTPVHAGVSTFTFKATDASGATVSKTLSITIQSSTTSGTPVTTAPPVSSADTVAPSVPANLSVSSVSTSQINVSWTASTDNVGVVGYKVYRNGVLLATTAGLSYSNTGLSAGTAYSYAVMAYDAAGNISAQSASVSTTTKTATTTSTATTGTGTTGTTGSSGTTATGGANIYIAQSAAGSGEWHQLCQRRAGDVFQYGIQLGVRACFGQDRAGHDGASLWNIHFPCQDERPYRKGKRRFRQSDHNPL